MGEQATTGPTPYYDDELDNLQTLCKPCNAGKRDR